MLAATFLTAWALSAGAGSPPGGSVDAFEQLKALSGEWEADLPGIGKLTNSIRLVSNGKAVEETIGTPADNEVSIYTRDGNRILLTHFCAMTPQGHQARLETAPLSATHDGLLFVFRDAINLPTPAAPHMRRVLLSFGDRDHFREEWTKTEGSTDVVFVLTFARRH
jgi:hypothetical protein